MPTNDIQLTAGIRNNLLLLQFTSEKIDRTQQRLATGNKINSAIDGAVAFFASKGLNRRADDLAQLKDSIGQSISTIKAADTGVTSIEKMLDQAKGLITSAYGSLGKDSASVALRKSLSDQFNNLLRQIDKQAGDATYQGKNLLLGSGLRLDATSSSKSATNAIIGISNTRVTNVVSADDYVVDITGDGAISTDASDIANAERDRGIQNLTISGFASKTLGNFDNVVIKYAGGKGKDKTFTITEGSIAVTKTFTTEQWDNAKATGRLLNFDHQFASGTHINFDVDFDEIDDVPDTAGVGTSVIEKNVNVAVSSHQPQRRRPAHRAQRPQPVGPAEARQRRERLGLRLRHAAHDGGRAHHPAGRRLQRDRRQRLWPRLGRDRRHAGHSDRRDINRHRQRLHLLPHRLRHRGRLQLRDRHVRQLRRDLGRPERRRHHDGQRERVLYLLRGGRCGPERDPRSADRRLPGHRPGGRLHRGPGQRAPSRRSARRCRAPACR